MVNIIRDQIRIRGWRIALVCAAAFFLFCNGNTYAEDNIPGENTQDTVSPTEFTVTTISDSGKGSLRQAILDANASTGPTIITFASEDSPFAEGPQEIKLNTELPLIRGELTIEGYIQGRLWKASGVTISGAGKHSVLRISTDASVTINNLTVADGQADNGGGIVHKEGTLVIKGVTFIDNKAELDGGALISQGGTVTVINSTFTGNRAEKRGGGIAVVGGDITITNCTFSGNNAVQGGGLFCNTHLLLSNTILANSEGGNDCVSEGIFDPAGTRNIIESNSGCGTPISSEDPRLEALGYYNGPAKTFPLGGGSHAINLGDNAAAVDEHGEALVWDQRGNGDPRFVAGFTDIGAFERQAHAVLTVDTVEDSVLRACTPAGQEDCPLRAAVEIANAYGKIAVIHFDPKIFAEPQAIVLHQPLPELTVDTTFDATGSAPVTIKASKEFSIFTKEDENKIELIGVGLTHQDKEKRGSDLP